MIVNSTVNSRRDLGKEWQAFLRRRLTQDFHLLHELSAARAPNQVWNAWSSFWKTAAEDYGREYSVMVSLMAGSLPDEEPREQEASRSDTFISQPQSKAA